MQGSLDAGNTAPITFFEPARLMRASSRRQRDRRLRSSGLRLYQQGCRLSSRRWSVLLPRVSSLDGVYVPVLDC